MAQKLSSLPVGAYGAKVKFGALYGVPIVWKLGDKNHSGYPENSVTLVADNVIKIMCFDAKEPTSDNSNHRDYGNGEYGLSNIRQWLNSAEAAGEWYTAQHSADAPPSSDNLPSYGYNAYDTAPGFLNEFTADEGISLLETTVPYSYKGVKRTSLDKVFLLSLTEVGASTDSSVGAIIPCFSDDASRIRLVTAECVANDNRPSSPIAGDAYKWWVRSSNSDSLVDYINDDGRNLLENANPYSDGVGLVCACNLSGDMLVSDSTDADGCYTIVYNQTPTAPGTITVPSQIYGGGSATISWGAATDVDGNLSGYALEQKVDSGEWEQIYQGANRTYIAPVTYGWITAQYRVRAYDSEGEYSDYTTSATRTIINNRAPVISSDELENTDLGIFSDGGPIFNYTVTDEDGDELTVVEKLDDVVIRELIGTDEAYTFAFKTEEWKKVLNGSHTLVITATDPEGAAANLKLTFTKDVAAIDFEQTVAMVADDMPTKAIINIQGYFPAGCELTVYMCNNGNDAEPTWEDVTQSALYSNKIFFANTAKTADTWGVKVKVHLARGTAAEACYITSLGGNFV